MQHTTAWKYAIAHNVPLQIAFLVKLQIAFLVKLQIASIPGQSV